MANLFYAVFGMCRQRGGTKKKCYLKAIETIEKKAKKKRKTKRRKASKKRRSR